MNDRIFISTEVIKILEIPQRRITHLVNNGLIIPIQNAKGAGSKRLYSYINLLEFSLAESLFSLELSGIYLVKMIISELRKEGIFQFWAEDFEGYRDYLAKKEKLPAKWIEITKTRMGCLFYCFRKDMKDEVIILPRELMLLDGIRSIYEEMFDSKALIIINLGEIKEKLDKAISEKG